MKLIKGKPIAEKILKELKRKIKNLDRKPGLAVVLVGENEASKLYIELKRKAAKRVGINFKLHKLNSNINKSKILNLIESLNKDEKVDGIIVQLPLPKKFSAWRIISLIDPEKDADGFSPTGARQPVFPLAVMRILRSTGLRLSGKRCAVIANSREFGTVMKEALKKSRIESTIISGKDLKRKANMLSRFDILVSALGRPGSIKGSMIKKGAIIIDGGVVKKKRGVYGDVDRESVFGKAGYLSPVPGGVGPVTVATLLESVYRLSKRHF